MPVPVRDSRKFCACAGPCEPQPITPICCMPANAFGNNAKRSLPPRTIRSSVSPRRITWVSNTLELKSHCIRDTSYVYRPFANKPESSQKPLIRRGQLCFCYPLRQGRHCSIMSRQGRPGRKGRETTVLTEENTGQRRSVQSASTGRCSARVACVLSAGARRNQQFLQCLPWFCGTGVGLVPHRS